MHHVRCTIHHAPWTIHHAHRRIYVCRSAKRTWGQNAARTARRKASRKKRLGEGEGEGDDVDMKQEEGQAQKCQALVEVQRTTAKALMRGSVRK